VIFFVFIVLMWA